MTLFGLGTMNAQSGSNVEDGQLQLNLLLPGVSYELGVSNNCTVYGEFAIGMAARGCTGCETQYGVFPAFISQFRHYYNFERRQQKGKRTTGNSGNYIGALAMVQSGNPLFGDLRYNYNAIVGLSPVYGLQRTYSKGFNFRLDFGFGAALVDNEIQAMPVVDLRLGWVLSKKK